MSEASYVSRALAFGLAGALLLGSVAAYFAAHVSLRNRLQPRLIEVDCLEVERGPTLRFESGLIKNSGTIVGTYRFLPASPGKYGPKIEVQGIQVRQVGETVLIERGHEDWFWRFLDDDTVEVASYSQKALARRCPT